jgi:hypothetical protein
VLTHPDQQQSWSEKDLAWDVLKTKKCSICIRFVLIVSGDRMVSHKTLQAGCIWLKVSSSRIIPIPWFSLVSSLRTQIKTLLWTSHRHNANSLHAHSLCHCSHPLASTDEALDCHLSFFFLNPCVWSSSFHQMFSLSFSEWLYKYRLTVWSQIQLRSYEQKRLLNSFEITFIQLWLYLNSKSFTGIHPVHPLLSLQNSL